MAGTGDIEKGGRKARLKMHTGIGKLQEGIYLNTDMVVAQENIYDTSGVWIKANDGESYIQLLPVDIDPELIKYLSKNMEGYFWDDSLLGIKK